MLPQGVVLAIVLSAYGALRGPYQKFDYSRASLFPDVIVVRRTRGWFVAFDNAGKL